MWRLSDPAVFAALTRSRTRVHEGPVTVSWVPGDPGEPPRVAYAISRRVGGAVVRNRLRRRLRAIVATADTAPGAYLVRVTPAAATLPFPELQALVRSALRGLTRRIGQPA